MPDLSFFIDGATPVPYAAVPLVAFQLRIENHHAEPVHSIALQCQIQIEAPRRGYSPDEQGRLDDLFGKPEEWGRTLRSMLWTHASVNVPSFTGSALVDVPVPCTFDFNVASTKYFYGLDHGEAPLCFLFSGTVFYQDAEAGLQVARISWSKEARFRLPVGVWKQLMDLYYPNCAWLNLRRDVFDRLIEYKQEHGIGTWEQVMERLLDPAMQEEVQLRALA